MGTPSLPTTPTISEIEEAIGRPQERWAHDCHSVSLAIVKSDLFDGPRRVARGTCSGVFGQHSWVVLGNDCYDPQAPILDATLWSYVPEAPVVFIGTRETWNHRPHGTGSIFAAPMPYQVSGEAIDLSPGAPLSEAAQHFLELMGPLDARGWMMLAGSPVEGWPAAEIIDAMYRNDRLRVFIPVDHVGMLTDHNPGEGYLP